MTRLWVPQAQVRRSGRSTIESAVSGLLSAAEREALLRDSHPVPQVPYATTWVTVESRAPLRVIPRARRRRPALEGDHRSRIG
jgi:hypothetical protein